MAILRKELRLSYLVLLLCSFMRVRGDYFLRVQVHSYNNPTNRCPTCTFDPNFEGQLGCCDNFDRTSCRPNERCDNEFFFCLRPLMTPRDTLQAFQQTVSVRSVVERAELLQCLQPPGALRSGINTDGRGIDFLRTTFLGLPNPLQFTVSTSQWEGIQLYIDVIDRDDGPPDELIHSFIIDIFQRLAAGSGMTAPNVFNGTFATITLSAEVECLPGFVGETCVPICSTEPCSNTGTCLPSGAGGFTCVCSGDYTGDTCQNRIDPCQGVDCNDGTCLPSGAGGFMCVCSGDFTGDTCQNRIDDCQGVDCNNNGTCVDEVRSFTCLCQQGFTGQLCDTLLTTPPFTTTAATTITANTSNNVGLVTGAVVGSIVFIIIIIAIIAAIGIGLLVQARKHTNKDPFQGESEGTNGTLDNPVYGTGPTNSNEYNEATMDNPIYGTSLSDDEETAGGNNPIYGLPDGEDLYDTAEGVEDTHHTSDNTAEATYDVPDNSEVMYGNITS